MSAWPCAIARVRCGARLSALGDEPPQRLPALTRGEGVLECAFDRCRPVSGAIPSRLWSDDSPLNREEYLLRVARRVQQRSGCVSGRGDARVRS